MTHDQIARNFGLIILSLFIYVKILDINNVSKTKKILVIIISFIVSIPLTLTHELIQTLLFPIVIFVFVCVIARVHKALMITSVIIAVGICFGIDIISQTILFIPMTLLNAIFITVKMAQENIAPENYWNEVENIVDVKLVNVILSYSLFFVDLIFANIIFKIKRLKKGFVFLRQKENRLIGIVFSIIIYLFIIYIDIKIGYIEEYSDIKTDDFSLIFFALIAMNVCTLGIHFWWRHHTTVTYKQRLKDRTIEEKDKQIDYLSECNDFLSETVHKDNKLIPALYNAVSSFLNNTEENIEEGTKIKGTHILSELEDIMQERKEMILRFQREHKPLSSTGVERIDNILNYMFQRAAEKDIKLDLEMSESLTNIIESVIPKQELESLLADLLENSIIAVSFSTCKKILVTMAIADDCYEITIRDSGIPFEIETLVDLGIKKSTTHAGKGGSGIGYLTIFKILGECGASLIISEQELEEHSYPKSVKIRFDGKSEFAVYSYRAKKIKQLADRNDMLIFESN